MKQKQKFDAFSQALKGTAFTLCSAILLGSVAKAQTALPLNDLSAFQTTGSNWRIAGSAAADFTKNNNLNGDKGTGVLLNLPDKKAANIFSTFKHGDVDLELDYMMAKGSNSGIYLQGRYEVQLFDSWGVKNPRPSDNGGIYERWEESRPEGSKGYEGHAPRQNVSRAPGLWQHMRISFQAPRFDASGRKIENAKMLRVELNGVIIQENVEMTGPTRGAAANDEVAFAPLMIQGDHGPVAFRNMTVMNYDKPRPELTDLRYRIYKGKFEKEPDFAKYPPEAEGTTTIISSAVNKIPNEFLIRYTGTLKVKAPGEYKFNLSAPGGGGTMKINNQIVVPITGNGSGKVMLQEGTFPFELLYSKYVSWTKPALGLYVNGPGIRDYLISDANTSSNEVVDPILIDAQKNTVLRSFMDIPGGPRVTHAVNVGSASGVNYTYDLNKGAIVQMWRGGFLDATPMWHSRGDGSSRPIGTVQFFGKPVFAVAPMANAQAAWTEDTVGSGYRPKGYLLDDNDQPTFRYMAYGATITDAPRVLENGQGLQRTISVSNSVPNFHVRLASAKNIESAGNGLYLMDDKSYYLRIDDAGGATPVIRDAGGRKELLLPIQKEARYSILF